eukprot:539595-Pleurochrysis_carterae.AAC.1
MDVKAGAGSRSLGAACDAVDSRGPPLVKALGGGYRAKPLAPAWGVVCQNAHRQAAELSDHVGLASN